MACVVKVIPVTDWSSFHCKFYFLNLTVGPGAKDPHRAQAEFWVSVAA